MKVSCHPRHWSSFPGHMALSVFSLSLSFLWLDNPLFLLFPGLLSEYFQHPTFMPSRGPRPEYPHAAICISSLFPFFILSIVLIRLDGLAPRLVGPDNGAWNYLCPPTLFFYLFLYLFLSIQDSERPLRYCRYIPLKSKQKVSTTNRIHFTDARRYFKQSEIILYRQAPDALPGPSLALQQPHPHQPQPQSQSQSVPQKMVEDHSGENGDGQQENPETSMGSPPSESQHVPPAAA